MEELRSVLEVAYIMAVDAASLEVAEGRYETEELETMVNQEEIINQALALISFNCQLDNSNNIYYRF